MMDETSGTNRPDKCKSDFEKFLMEAVDQEFSALGYSCKEAIYSCLESAFDIKKAEIPERIEEFAKAIENMFGTAARLLEIRIIKAVCQRVKEFKYSPKNGDIVFAEYLIALRGFL